MREICLVAERDVGRHAPAGAAAAVAAQQLTCGRRGA